MKIRELEEKWILFVLSLLNEEVQIEKNKSRTPHPEVKEFKHDKRENKKRRSIL